MPQETGNVTVRMPIKTQKKLDRIAAEADRSRNWLINAAIVQYLEVYDWQEKRIRERLKKGEKEGSSIRRLKSMPSLSPSNNGGGMA